MKSGLVFNFDEYVLSRRQNIESELEKILAQTRPDVLWDSMRYSVLSGGKRVRGLLCLAAAEACGGPAAQQVALSCACALELIHAMSLIHDDLPCMDNDDYRRGRLTNHKVYGEAMALLAGDALLAYAQQVVLERTANCPPSRIIQVAAGLARAAGPSGMVGGQVLDMEATGKASADAESLKAIHACKTGALLAFSVWSGACLAGADEILLSLFQEFGEILGLAFQIADDLLDVTGELASLGKTPGKDQAAGKLTWISVYGVEASKQELARLADAGQALLSSSGPNAESIQPLLSAESIQPLSALLSYAVNRTH